jgi:hypothetical protein
LIAYSNRSVTIKRLTPIYFEVQRQRRDITPNQAFEHLQVRVYSLFMARDSP